MQELKPFSQGAFGVRLFAEVQISENEFRWNFRVDDPDALVLGAPESANAWGKSEATRADNLWKVTCFEAFWARPGERTYWELNFSPFGEWALYHFDDYRTPYPPISNADFELLRLETQPGMASCTLEAKIPLPEWNMSLCTVLKMKDDKIHYFSTNHASEKPDFHSRKSFILSKGSK